MQAAVTERMRDSRADRSNEVRDMVDQCDVGIEEELSFALLQMRTEALVGLDAALARLDASKYGVCRDCGSEIAEGRLHAMPFAVRCRRCEETLEEAHGRQRRRERQNGAPLLSEFSGA